MNYGGMVKWIMVWGNKYFVAQCLVQIVRMEVMEVLNLLRRLCLMCYIIDLIV